MNSANLVDYWRVKNPDTSQFSWFNASGNGQRSRIDFWLISLSLANFINKCEISASPLTDHFVITLSLLLTNDNIGVVKTWKFNNTLLNNTYFCHKVKQLLTETDLLAMSSISKWEWFKFKVKEIAIQTSKYLSRQKRQSN